MHMESVGETLGDKLAPMLTRMKIKTPTLDEIRSQFPELADLSDVAVRSKANELVFVKDIQNRCAKCTGFETCWRETDAAGEVRVVEVINGRIDIRSVTCSPKKEHDAKHRRDRLLDESGMTDDDRALTFQ